MSDKYTVRTKYTGDKVYLIDGKTRAWIRNPETLAKLGFELGTEKTIPYEELIEFEDIEPIDLKEKTDNTGDVPSEQIVYETNPVMGYKERATLDDFKNYDEKA